MNNVSAKKYSLNKEVGVGRTLLLLLFFVAAVYEIYCLQLPLAMALVSVKSCKFWHCLLPL